MKRKTVPQSLFDPVAWERHESLSVGNQQTEFFDPSFGTAPAGTQRAGTFLGNIVAASRLAWGGALALAVLAVFLLHASWLQIAQGERYRGIADQNRTRVQVIPAERGIITDRDGTPLATNVPFFTLVMHPALIPTTDDERSRTFAAVAAIAPVSADALTDFYKTRSETNEEIVVLEDVPYDVALRFRMDDANIPGIDLVLSTRRSYITDRLPSLSHVLGYTGPLSPDEYQARLAEGYVSYDYLGKQGVEAQYEAKLRGTYGKIITEVDAQGKDIRTITKTDAIAGERLTLSLHAGLQEQAEKIIAAWLQGATTKRASLVAMDPRNGEILALVSYPSYDANMFARGVSDEEYAALLDDPDRPLFPRAVAGAYPAGSTIKPLYAAAALTEGIITPSTSFVSSGGLWIGNRFFPDWLPGGHGVTNVYSALANSVNTFFYIVGGGYDTFQGLGVTKLMAWAERFGLGSTSGIDLPGEHSGFLPSPEWKKAETGEPWYVGDTYNVSIGQGDILVNPVQMTRVTAAIANGGLLVRPHVDMDAQVTDPHRIIDEDIADIVGQGMRLTVTSGTATSMQSVAVSVAGKTGTAQWSNSSPPHSWFTGFAPYDDPSIVVTVIVENGGDQGLAIPIAREVLEAYFGRR